MNSSICSHCLFFNAKALSANRGRRESRVFLCSKGRLGRKVPYFENYIASLKKRYNPDTLPNTNDHGIILLENERSTK